MLLFLLLYNVAQVVALLVALLQFGFSVFTGETNRPLLVLGLSLRACEEIDQRSAEWRDPGAAPRDTP